METHGQGGDRQHVIDPRRGLHVRDDDEALVLDRVHRLQGLVAQQELNLLVLVVGLVFARRIDCEDDFPGL